MEGFTRERIELKFTIDGKVKAKQSTRFTFKGFKYTNQDVVDYANWVKLCFKQAYPDFNPNSLVGFNLSIGINTYFKMPTTFSKKKKYMASVGLIRPTVKPDWDNIPKNICDALNGIAYPDDKAIVTGYSSKYYSDKEYVTVNIIGEKWNEVRKESNVKISDKPTKKKTTKGKSN